MAKASIFNTGKNMIELPLYARSLCREAIKVSNELCEKAGNKEVKAFSKDFFTKAEKYFDQKMLDELEKQDYDFFNFYEYPSRLDEIENTLKKLIEHIEDEEFKAEMMDSDSDEQDYLQFAVVLVLAVRSLKAAEFKFVSKRKFGYDLAMFELDQYAITLHRLLFQIKSLEPVREIAINRHSRLKGAKEGAAKRNEVYSEIKGIVIDEYISKHTHLNAAKAGREIAEYLKGKNMLNRENGHKIFEDPAARFTVWIRACKKLQIK